MPGIWRKESARGKYENGMEISFVASDASLTGLGCSETDAAQLTLNVGSNGWQG
jgi:hypothetical protein